MGVGFYVYFERRRQNIYMVSPNPQPVNASPAPIPVAPARRSTIQEPVPHRRPIAAPVQSSNDPYDMPLDGSPPTTRAKSAHIDPYDVPLVSTGEEGVYDFPVIDENKYIGSLSIGRGHEMYEAPPEQDAYEEPQKLPWLFDSLSREAAEKVILNDVKKKKAKHNNGRFLVRRLEGHGCFAVSVLWDGVILHHVLEEPLPGQWLVNGVQAPAFLYTLANLVEHFGQPGSWRSLLLTPITHLGLQKRVREMCKFT
jgi:hypothetical protein